MPAHDPHRFYVNAIMRGDEFDSPLIGAIPFRLLADGYLQSTVIRDDEFLSLGSRRYLDPDIHIVERLYGR